VTEAGERWERGSATSSNSSHFDFSSNPGRDSERAELSSVTYTAMITKNQIFLICKEIQYKQ
jgi:hypothetical protein